MKRCPDCKAPNPPIRATCYACGQILIARPAAQTAEPIYPCLSCRAPIPYSATACPGCGRVVKPPQPPDPRPNARIEGAPPAPAIASPGSWRVEPLPDGTALLRRSAAGRYRDIANVIVGGLSVAALIMVRAGSFLRPYAVAPDWTSGASGDPAMMVIAALFDVVIVAGAVYLVWLCFRREEMRVGPGLLTVRTELGFFHRERSVSGSAVFRIETSVVTAQLSSSLYRSLRVENMRARILIDQTSDTIRDDRPPTDDRVGALGRYLAQLTGWDLVDPHQQSPRAG
jgi:hypothetical protein